MMNNDTLFRLCRKIGLDIYGVADIDNLRGLKTGPPGLLENFTRVVVIGTHLSDWVFSHMPDGPTHLYLSQYKTANRFLDWAAFIIQGEIQRSRRRALAIPASQIVDEDSWRGSFFHQAAAVSAGVGWVGKNFLVVHPRFGPRIRLASILTDLPFKPAGKMVSSKCGQCRACVEACPAGALTGAPSEYRYESRSEALDVNRCVKFIERRIEKDPRIPELICGLCIAACPQGR
jgi:epoxyqueuosine reductase